MTETILDKAEASSASSSTSTSGTKPKLGFLGVGWIGRNRMEAISKYKAGEAWAARVANGEGLSVQAEEYVKVAEVLDKIYRR